MEQIDKIIGKRKYDALKALDLENINEDTLVAFNLQFKDITVAEGLKMIKDYETKFTYLSNEAKQSVQEYFDSIHKEAPKKEIKYITKTWLWTMFRKTYYYQNGIEYSKDNDSLENLKPLIYYFIGDEENFIKCDNLSSVSEPSLKKGLLIIGDYGNGKTTVMKALEASLKKTNVNFKTYSTNEVVDMFEACENAFDKDEFNKCMKSGTINFDDALTERVASNYGKADLMKDILEKRYDLNKRTYITCNYNDSFPIDLDEGLKQFGVRYGSRVYDRIFSMFNIIEFKGKSFRK